jgi:hypothetical protein
MKSPGLVDSEDPISNLLCELEPRLSETFELEPPADAVNATARNSGRALFAPKMGR